MAIQQLRAVLIAGLPCCVVQGGAGSGKSTTIRAALGAISATAIPVSGAALSADDVQGLCQLLVWSAACFLPSTSGSSDGTAEADDASTSFSLRSKFKIKDSAGCIHALQRIVPDTQHVCLWLSHCEVLLNKHSAAWHLLCRLQAHVRPLPRCC